MNRVRNNPFQFILACALILGSVAIIVSAAQALYAQRSNTLHIPISLFEGSHTFSLMHGETCFGSLSTSLEPVDEFLSYSFQGQAQVSIQDRISIITVNGFLQINSLDQVFASVVTLQAGEQRWQLGTSGAVPITWHIKTITDPEASPHSGTLPGPLAIQRQDDLSYTVAHPLLDHIQPQRSSALASALASSFPVRVQESDCNDASGSLPLDPLLSQILPLANKMNLFR